MAVGDDEAKVRAERARAIGLFRYQMIREAADSAHSTKERGKMVRELASREHTDPFGRRVQFSRQGTVKLIGGLVIRVYRSRVVRRFWWKDLSQFTSGGGRGRHAGDFVPDREAVGHLVAPSGGRQQMPTRTEMWRDAAERRQEPLRVPG